MSWSYIIPLQLRRGFITSVQIIESSAASSCPAGVLPVVARPTARTGKDSFRHALGRRTSAVSIYAAFTCRPLRLRNVRGRNRAAANVPVQLRTRIVRLVAIHIQRSISVDDGGRGAHCQLTMFRRSPRCQSGIFENGELHPFYSSNWLFSLRRRARTRTGLPPSPRIRRMPERGGTHGRDPRR